MESQDRNVLDVDVGLLIRLVQHFPHIYDHTHKHFKNGILKENTWRRIAGTIKVPVEDCLRVWKNLRDKFTREQRILKSHPRDCQNLSKWEFYDAMEFLNPYIKRRRTVTLRKRPSFMQITAKDNSNPPSPTSSVKLWDPITVKLSPESMTLLEGEFDDGSGEMEEATFEAAELSEISTRIKDDTDQQSTINIVRHQTSEEAFGAYIATRLMEFPPEIRQIKKAKLFKDLEEPEDVS
ncbi:uncharacterized protein LOC108915122 [Anoplophora glabripennis]|uniref:uncharacterized protein LOC108915122 n=1 Tax=Anoplophora glabripennis TaxID=217634 RepID=UPI0008756D98|nr:uncharacterized protein LOC108915122 [Anoplophora glabripennis]